MWHDQGAITMRFIAHLDMDAFYASVELLRYPELRGQPVAIGGGRAHQPETITHPVTGETTRRFRTLRGYVGRGVLTTATYEARALGLHSAQGIMKAAALAPDAILLPVDFDAYRAASRQFKAAVREIAPAIEDRGIDEIYIDLTEVVREAIDADGSDAASPPHAGDGTDDATPHDNATRDDDSTRADEATCADDATRDADATRADEATRDEATRDDGVPDDPRAWTAARAIAAQLKRAVRGATGLTCSIAVAPNKLLAKIASELDKPDGLTLLPRTELPKRIWPLPPRRVNGIGPKAAARLEALGITTIGALAAADIAFLTEHFGARYGAWLHDAAHGRDDRAVVTYSEPKSISRELTFERDLSARRDRDELSRIFTGLCHGVASDLQRKGYVARTIGLKLRYDDFRTVTRDHTLEAPTADPQLIRDAAGSCLKRVALERRIRLLGVRAGNLVPAAAAAVTVIRAAEPTPSLFD
jgi:nucleotidyltransferase/DNA polymerase involved in DNA repair